MYSNKKKHGGAQMLLIKINQVTCDINDGPTVRYVTLWTVKDVSGASVLVIQIA
jgi:hypothetical protein